MTRILLLIIRLYQKTVSPDHGLFRFCYPYGFCRYTPSCSQYAASALRKYGTIRGIMYALWRIFRCNPFSRGGSDPIVS